MTQTPARLVAIIATAWSITLAGGCGSSEPGPVAGAAQAPAGQLAAGENAFWYKFRDHFVDQYLAANPVRAAEAGRHEYDGTLPDLSQQGVTTYLQRLESWRQEAEAFVPSALGEAEQFERQYLLAELEEQAFWLAEVEIHRRNPLYYSRFINIDMYLDRDYAPLEVRLAGFTSLMEQSPGLLASMRQNLATPLPRSYLETAIGVFGGMAEFLSTAPAAIFGGVQDPALQNRLAESLTAAIAELEASVAWFKAQLPRATEAYALGPELYQRMLWVTERVDTPITQLKRVGEQDLQRNLTSLAQACEVFAPGASLGDCMSRAEANKPAEGAVKGATRQLAMLKQFLQEKDLVTIPGNEEALVGEAPPHRRFNLAYIRIPGPYEKGLPSIYFIAPPDPAWDEAQRNAYIPGEGKLLYVSVHEVWPGHFLNFLHAQRAASPLGRLFVGYAFSEGWAHYTEEMMLEAGLGKGNAEWWIGQLNNALLRNVRFLSSIGLHTQGMSVEESERMFLDSAFQDPGNARQQAYRGTYDPGYLNYTLGKLMIMKLKEDWLLEQKGDAGLKEFHDRFLSYGGPPVPMVREAMLAEDGGSLFPDDDQRQ